MTTQEACAVCNGLNTLTLEQALQTVQFINTGLKRVLFHVVQYETLSGVVAWYVDSTLTPQ